MGEPGGQTVGEGYGHVADAVDLPLQQADVQEATGRAAAERQRRLGAAQLVEQRGACGADDQRVRQERLGLG